MHTALEPTSLGIGIDTGGTYTDVAIVDLSTDTVLSTAKRPTTHHDLSIGITQALDHAARHVPLTGNAIKRIALSTTLATNAIVEGQGADVGLLVIGRVKHFSSPVLGIRFIKGGHTITGEEAEPIDLETVVETIEDFRGHVQAYAVCAAMSFVNPAHEEVVRKAISLYDPRPVFCSHEISTRAGMEERAQTAVINARLLPLMKTFLAGVQPPLKALAPEADMRVLRGDGGFMSLHDAEQHAADTVSSGPAATACFGASACPTGMAAIVDVGGTTTDITLIRDGSPILQKDGSLIGGWHTHVQSVDMSTIGAGGDSRVRITPDKDISLGPERVVPLSLAEGFPAPDTWIGPGTRAVCIRAIKTDAGDPILSWLNAYGPATLEALICGTGLGEIPLSSRLDTLRHRQAVVETGFTPTDALHVLGRLDMGNTDRAANGAASIAAYSHTTPEGLSEQIIYTIEVMIEDAIIDHLMRYGFNASLNRSFPGYRNHPLLGVQFDVKIPLIGIGAASAHFLPAVAERLGTELRLPDHYAVGNALGAIRAK
ncbi:MAG: hydantoinase/oxoprolinase [Deltaproteobacteria bacterium]|nr:MAG: hydantoinase/oxoprolinase [Deltaproteobacteria bacterium]